jgi:hypothetical protein
MTETIIQYKDPLPLIEPQYEASLYPVDALPSIIKESILAYQQYGQQPTSLIASGALANISLSCQTLANVARDHLLVSPISLYFITLGASGERKTASDKAFGQGVKQWQLETRERLMPHVTSSSIAYHAWASERDGLLRKITKAGSNGEPTQELQDQLHYVLTNEPAVSLLPELFFEDTTQEAFTESLANGWPSSSLWSDEGGIVVSSHGMQSNTTKFISTLNRLWDGNHFITSRKTSKSFIVAHRRITVSLMLQPLLLKQLLARQDGLTRQSGFLARTLITYPISPMGERYYKNPPKSLTSLNNFHQRIRECLDLTLGLDRKGCHKIPTLVFSKNGKAQWVDFFNEVEKGVSTTGQWRSIQDFASKAAENVARLSALFHLFLGKEGKIDAETTEQAIAVIKWHLEETKRMIDKSAEEHPTRDAQKLLNWFKNKNLSEVTPRYFQQHSAIRDKYRLNKAIETLIEHHYLIEKVYTNKTTLSLNPKIIQE